MIQFLLYASALCAIQTHCAAAQAQDALCSYTNGAMPLCGTLRETFVESTDKIAGWDIVYTVVLYDSTAQAFFEDQVVPVYERMCTIPWSDSLRDNWDFGDFNTYLVDAGLMRAWEVSLRLMVIDCFDSVLVSMEDWGPEILDPEGKEDEGIRIILFSRKSFSMPHGIVQVHFEVPYWRRR